VRATDDERPNAQRRIGQTIKGRVEGTPRPRAATGQAGELTIDRIRRVPARAPAPLGRAVRSHEERAGNREHEPRRGHAFALTPMPWSARATGASAPRAPVEAALERCS